MPDIMIAKKKKKHQIGRRITISILVYTHWQAAAHTVLTRMTRLLTGIHGADSDDQRARAGFAAAARAVADARAPSVVSAAARPAAAPARRSRAESRVP